MRYSKAALGFLLITLLNIGVLVWLDVRSGVLGSISQAARQLPVLIGFALASWVVRYLRWNWLLAKTGSHYHFLHGFAAYLSGFAFTASPGKVGELVRIRYFAPLGVPHEKIIAAFVFERLCDLIVVLLLSLLIASKFDVFWLAVGFVITVFVTLVVLIFKPRLLRRVYVSLRFTRWRRLLRVVRYLMLGVQGMRGWMTPSLLIGSISVGFVAWGLIAAAFMWLVSEWNMDLQPLVALAVYPLAMLIGAASMIPGGLGSTEASIVAVLYTFDVPLQQGALVAVTIRIATLWSAILAGMLALFYLERLFFRKPTSKPANTQMQSTSDGGDKPASMPESKIQPLKYKSRDGGNDQHD